ncbi:MAG: Gp19/Gp15/Gp42 family protein [Huintestinicola sp.]
MNKAVRYAELSDITALGKSLTPEQSEAAEILLSTASSKLRITAAKYGKNIDEMISDETLGKDYAIAVKSVIVQSVCRALDSIADSSPAITQGSQAALGYSVSMTYLNAGQSLYFLRNELKDLGILRQTYGAMEVYSYDTDD